MKRPVMKKQLVRISVLILVLALTGCAFTPSFRDAAGKLPPQSIAALEKHTLGGMEQWLLIRGQDTRNPVLLWLHGGPGAAQMPIARRTTGALEADYVMVHWDQRGAGKSNPRSFDTRTMTVEQYLTDAHELTVYLKQRFHKQKIVLLGHSWGSQLGLLLAAAYPEDYAAYVGLGQLINPREGPEIAYAWLKAKLAAEGKSKELKRLAEIGPPPYAEHDRYVSFILMVDAQGGSFDCGMGRLARMALGAPEYRGGDYLRWLRGSNRGSGPMWEATQTFDALAQVPALDIPVYFFNGRHDYNTPLALVKDYYFSLEAPAGKELVVFEHSAHTPFIAEPEKFIRELRRVREEIGD